MISCWDNFLPVSFFKIIPYKFNEDVLTYNFLSFQDAFNFLIKKYHLYNKTILIPNFYCDSTIINYKKHLKVIFCGTDKECFDIDYQDFINKLKNEKPHIILIYNYFGKNSILYKNLEWNKYLSGEEIIISDFAHSIYANHDLVFFTDKHFYIDSTRKTTTFMTSQIAFSKKISLDFSNVIRINFFKINIRILYAIKNLLLIFSVYLNSNILGNLGCKLFLIHDAKIGNDDNSINPTWQKTHKSIRQCVS